MNKPTEKIWAVSMAPGARQVPVHVQRKLMKSPAWRIHKMREVGDPTMDPQPFKSPMGPPTKAERAKIAQLQAERDELQAKFDAMAAELEAAKSGAKEVKQTKPA